MKYDDIKIGKYYNYNYTNVGFNGFATVFSQLIFVVGRDPFSDKLVVSCSQWADGIGYLTDEEAQFLEDC